MRKLILFFLLIPFFANAQWTAGSIQRNGTNGDIRYFQGSNDIKLAKYADLPVVPAGITDSLLKKANRDMSNVASGAIALSKIDTSATGVRTAANSLSLAQLQTRLNGYVNLTSNQTIGGTKTFSSNIVVPGFNSATRLNVVNGALAQGINVGSLLVSGSYADVTNVPTNGMYVVGGIANAFLGSSGNIIVYANNSGLLGKMNIGSGLSFNDATQTLSATGGSAGTITGSGTAGTIPIWNSASDIGNSYITATTSGISIIPTASSGTMAASNQFELSRNVNGIFLRMGDGSGGQAVTLRGYTGTYQLTLNNGGIEAAGAANFTGSITGSSFIGSGSGLTGTAASLTAGNATKLATARTINGTSFDGTANISIGTTVGQSFIGLTNPSAITFPRINANNTVSALSASDFRTAIGAGTGSGSVMSVFAGNGMNFATISGSGSVSMGTPSSITSTSTNTVSGTTHTHAITSLPSTVTATTQTTGDNSTRVATTAFVQTTANAKVQNSLTASTTIAPSATAVNTALALKANLSGATFTGSISATNLSGTNTGDNATNTTSNAYADSKVQNSLTASTTVAPSATAVNTALASKVGSVSAGNGMDFTTITNSGSVTLGTPSSITSTSTNLVSETSHSHAITSLPSSVTATTQAANTNNTTVATTAYADAKVQNSLTASTTVAPSATAVNTALALKANLSGATFTGAINGTTATFSGDVTANSDRRLKRDIRRIKNVSGSLRALGAYLYKMKGSNADKIGLIAQQVEKYYPQLVITDSKGIKSVNYQAFTAVLLQGWKELDDRVTKLEKK